MSDRHSKWQRVEPGTVIPAGQPYRVEFDDPQLIAAREHRGDAIPWKVGREFRSSGPCAVFVDSSWKPPLVLPTDYALIRATVDDRYTENVILLHGPHPSGLWWDWNGDYRFIPDDINEVVEVLWRSGE